MISFIVIGKNEGKKLKNCIQSIRDTISYNDINNSEIIYVDSNSSDNSVKLLDEFENIHIYRIESESNAAVARNLGAEKSNGDVLFFIDGDMEVIPENFSQFYNSNSKKLEYPFISGDFINYYYNKNGELLDKEHHYGITSDIYQASVGGIFFIERSLWNSVGGMRSIFRKSQDIDLGLRVSAKGYKLLRKKETIAKHHTVEYIAGHRFWDDFFSGNYLFRGLLYKYNCLNKFTYRRYIKKEVTIAVFIFVLACSIFGIAYPLILLLYPISVVMKIFFKKREKKIWYFIVYIILDLSTIFSLMFFWPSPINNISYTKTK